MQVMAQSQLGQLEVRVTSNRGHSAEELADAAVEKILYVGESVHPIIREQALAFQGNIKQIIAFYIKQGIASDRTTVANILTNAGHPELAKIIGV
jgi:hypothetical protein